MLSSVAGMGKMRRLGSLLVLKVQESPACQSGSGPQSVSPQTAQWNRSSALIALILRQFRIDVEFGSGDGEDAAAGIAVGFDRPDAPCMPKRIRAPVCVSTDCPVESFLCINSPHSAPNSD